jgi:hypothetical protein
LLHSLPDILTRYVGTASLRLAIEVHQAAADVNACFYTKVCGDQHHQEQRNRAFPPSLSPPIRSIISLAEAPVWRNFLSFGVSLTAHERWLAAK